MEVGMLSICLSLLSYLLSKCWKSFTNFCDNWSGEWMFRNQGMQMIVLRVYRLGMIQFSA
jgi:hypothetical protein